MPVDQRIECDLKVWLAFAQNKATGCVTLRSRIIKAFDLKGGRGMIVVANARGGVLEGWTMFQTKDFKYLNSQRSGKLWWGRK